MESKHTKQTQSERSMKFFHKKRKPEHIRNGVEDGLYGRDSDWEEDEETGKRKPFSLVGNLVFLVTIGLILGIGWLVCLTWAPQDLSKLPGYRQAEGAPDILELVRQSDKNNSALTLTENDVNRYLASTVKAAQNGILSAVARPNGIGIRFHEGYMEIIIERRVGINLRQTVSMYVTVIQEVDQASNLPVTRLEYCVADDRNSFIKIGGSLGQLEIPQGYILFLRPAYENLASSYQELLTTIIDSGKIIRISPGRIDLLPYQTL